MQKEQRGEKIRKIHTAEEETFPFLSSIHRETIKTDRIYNSFKATRKTARTLCIQTSVFAVR
jgi:hypothetical protein